MDPAAARRRLAAALAVGAIGALSLGFAAPASAAVSHAFTATYGAASSTPVDPYPVSEPTDVAVDNVTHDIYVTDPGNHRVEKLDPSGNFILMFGKEVDKTTGGDVCTAVSGDECKEGKNESSPGSLETPRYLAIDNYPGGEGDVYVADAGDGIVSKFDPSGHIIKGWGNTGQKDGSDSVTVKLESGEEEEGLPGFGTPFGVAVGQNGKLYVGALNFGPHVMVYTQSGEYLYWTGSTSPWLKVDSAGNIYSTNNCNGSEVFGCWSYQGNVIETVGPPRETNQFEVTEDFPATGFAFDPVGGELYEAVTTRTEEGKTLHASRVDHYASDCNPEAAICEPVDFFGTGHLAVAETKEESSYLRTGVAVNGETGTVFVANPQQNAIEVFGDVRPKVTTGPPTGVTETGVTLTGHIDPLGHGEITECEFEWGFDTSYGHTVPCSPAIPPNYTGPTDVTANLGGFSAGTREHYRLVVTNSAGAHGVGLDETFTTTAPPAIDGLIAEHLTATSAELLAQVNPNGVDTTYHFQYGPSLGYGKEVEGTIGASSSDQQITAQLSNLTPHIVYHYRLVAENADGVTTTEDHTFNFYPPTCPNENVRQQTEANFLPDCRAYELVSPEYARGTQLYAAGPFTGEATTPSRLAFVGLFSVIPNSGGDPIDSFGDLYVATRTNSGWVTRYVGIPANLAPVDGGPSLGPPGSVPGAIRNSTQISGHEFVTGQDAVYTDRGMNTFLDFNTGNQALESIFGADFQNHTAIGSNAPYVWAANGSPEGRLPTNLGSVPPGAYNSTYYYSHGGVLTREDHPLTVSPGGMKALDCPYVTESTEHQPAGDYCPGDVAASADLSHFVFATEWNLFAPGGNLEAPGSVYDNNVGKATVKVASLTPAGGNIPSEPLDQAADPLQIPAVSSDGTHILMAAGGTGPCGFTVCPVPPVGDDYNMVKRAPMQPSHLYMRVNESVTYDVSQGHDVTFIGSTAGGSKVFFTSEEQLTSEDHDASSDLYMWSQKGAEEDHPLTLISKGSGADSYGEPGNSDSCTASFVPKCGVLPYNKSNPYYCEQWMIGGKCMADGYMAAADTFIASQSGDIYFFSPEILDGSRGVPNQQNLYVYREGHAQYVTTLAGAPTCWATYTKPLQAGGECARIVRMEVTPDGHYMGFITASQVTQYNNAGHLEMYVYNAETRRIICASCKPNGEPPTADVYGSQDGLFLTNDGRAFFSTDDALVHVDTNRAEDVYEYVDGHPQLITPGTGETRAPTTFFLTPTPGLVGVSAEGRDVYFSTFDTLVRQDHNGLFLKFYDARVGGGFPAPAPPPPCEAADECHGAGSSPPPPIQADTSANLAGGNVKARHAKHAKRGRHRRRGRRHAHRKRGGAR